MRAIFKDQRQIKREQKKNCEYKFNTSLIWTRIAPSILEEEHKESGWFILRGA